MRDADNGTNQENDRHGRSVEHKPQSYSPIIDVDHGGGGDGYDVVDDAALTIALLALHRIMERAPTARTRVPVDIPPLSLTLHFRSVWLSFRVCSSRASELRESERNRREHGRGKGKLAGRRQEQ